MLDKNNRFNYGVDSGSGNAQNLSNLQNAYSSGRPSWLSTGVKGAVLGLGLATLLPLTASAASPGSSVPYSDYPGPEGYQWEWPAAPTVGGEYLDTVDVKWNPMQPVPAVTPPDGIHLTYGTPINDDLVLQGQITVTDKKGTPIDPTTTGKFQYVVEKVLYPIGGPYNVFAYYFLDKDKSELKTDDYDGCQHQYLYVDPGVPELKWDTPEAITYGTLLSATQLNATCLTIDAATKQTLQGTYTYDPKAGTLLDAGTHTLTVTFVPANTNYLTVSTNVQLVVNKADLDDKFSWGDPTLDILTYGDTFTVKNIHYTTTVPGTVTTDPDMLNTQPNAGEYPLTLTFTPDSNNYNPAIAERTLIVNKATPVISWDTPVRAEKGTQFAKSATATGVFGENVEGDFVYNPPFPVTFDQVPAQTLTAAFTPTGNFVVNYNPVTETRVVEVFTKIPVDLIWATPDDIIYGTALGLAMEMDQRGIKVDGIQLNALAVVAGSPLRVPVDGRYVYIPEEGNILPAGRHELKVTFTPTNTDIYETATGSVWINVLKAKPIVNWEPLSPITYGTPLSDDQLNATFTWTIGTTNVVVDGTPVYDPADGKILPVGTNPLKVTFTPADTDNYEVVTGNAEVVVEKDEPIIDWGDNGRLQDIVYGTALGLNQLNAVAKDSTGAEIPGTYAYDPQEGTILNAGDDQPITVTFTPESGNYDTATMTVVINVLKATPIVTWEPTTPITYGTPLSNDQLNAAFTWNVDGQGEVTVEGTATYEPVLGTVLPAGTQTLKLVKFEASGDTYRPNHPENYNEVDEEVEIVVEQATLTITIDDKSILFNADAPEYTYTIEGFVNGDTTESVFGKAPVATSDYVKGDPVGTYPIYIDPAPTADNYDVVVVEGTLTVGVKEPDIIWYKPLPIIQGTPLVRDDSQRGKKDVPGVQLNALAVEDKNVPEDKLVEIFGTYVYEPAEGTDDLPIGENILSVTFTPDKQYGDNYKAATAVVVLLVQAKPVITWDDPQVIDYATGEKRSTMGKLLNATVTVDGKDISGLGNFVYTWTQSGNVIKPTANTPEAGTYPDWLKVEFVLDPSVADKYAQPDPVIVDLIVNKATPVIHWNDPRQPGTYELVPQGMEIPEPPVYQLADITYGTELTDADQLNAYVKGSLKGSMIYTIPATMPPAGWNTLYVTFTPDESYAKNYDAITVFNLIYVKYADLDEVVWDKPADITYGTPLSDDQYSKLMYGLVGTNKVEGTAANQNPALGEILPAGEHTLNASFVPNDKNYNQKDGLTQKLTVKKATPEVTIGQEPTNPQEIIEIDYGTLIDPTDPKINASAKGYDGNELEGDFTFEAYEYDPDTGKYILIDKDPTREYLDVLTEGNPQYMLRAIFTPTGDDADNYEDSTYVEKGLNVLPVAPTVEVETIEVPYGTELTIDDLTAATTVKGVETEDGEGYEDVEGTLAFFVDDVAFADVQQPLASGSHVLKAVFTPAAEETNYIEGEETGVIDIYGSVIIDWTIVSPITYGTPLTDDYFQAVVKDAETGNEVAGTKVYSIIFPDGSEIPGQAGVVLDAGTYYLKVEFTPEDTAEYDPAEKKVELVVTGKNPNALWFPFPMFYGQTPGDGQYNAKADVSGSFDYPEKPVWPTEVGEYDLNAPFTPEDPNYSKVDPVIGHLVILKAPIRFVWPAQDMYYGETPTDEKQFNAKAISTVTGEEVEGTFDYPRNEMPTAVGVYTLVAPWTPKDTRNYDSGIAYANIEIFGADPDDQLTWNPAALEYGKEAGDAQKNASSGTIAGHFEYPNMDGYNAGEYQVTANFISEDPNYTNGEVTATLKVTKAAPTVKFYKVVPAEEEGKDPTYEEIDEVTMAYGQIMKLNDDNTITITTEEEDDDSEVESASEFLTDTVISENNEEGDGEEEGEGEEEEESESEDMTIKVFVTGVDGKDVTGKVAFTLDGVKLPDLEQPLDPKEDPYKLKATFTSEDGNYANGNSTIDVIVEVGEGDVAVDWDMPDAYPWSEGLVWGDFGNMDAVAWNVYTEETLAWGDQLTYKYAPVDPDLVPEEDIDDMTLEEVLEKLNLTEEDLIDFDLNELANAGTYFLVAWYDDKVFGYGDDKDIIEIDPAKPTLEITTTTFTYGTTLYPESFGIYAYGTDGEPLTGDVAIYLDNTLVDNEGVTPEIGQYTLNVSFTPDDPNYVEAESTAVVTVRATSDIVEVLWDVPEFITYGDVIDLNAVAINTVDQEILAEGDELVYVINEEGMILPEGIALDAGTYQVMAIFIGAGEYEGVEADTGWLPVTVEPAEPTLSWEPAALVYGTPATAAQENATANVAGKFTYPDMSKLPVGKHEVTAKFTSGDPNFANGEVSAILEVTKATPVISWATPAPITYGTALSGEQLNASANVSGDFEYTPAAGTELEIGTWTLTTVFTPKDTANYNTATASVELTVIPNVDVEIIWEPKTPITYGTPLSVDQLNATANIEGHFYYNPTYGTILPAGRQKLAVTFIPTERKYYKNQYMEVYIDVEKLEQTINFEPIGVTQEGDVIELNATTSADLPVRFVSSNEDVAVIQDNIMTIVGGGTAVITAIQDGNENYEAVSAEQTIEVDSELPFISIKKVGDKAVITFTGTLEESDDTVTWKPVLDAKGSIEVDFDVLSKKFYRSVKSVAVLSEEE